MPKCSYPKETTTTEEGKILLCLWRRLKKRFEYADVFESYAIVLCRSERVRKTIVCKSIRSERHTRSNGKCRDGQVRYARIVSMRSG